MKRSKKAMAVLTSSILCIALTCSGCGEASRYEKAQQLLAQKNYVESAELFTKLGDYEDSAQYISYIEALHLGNAGEYEKAYTMMKNMEGFLDSKIWAAEYYEKDLAYRYSAAQALLDQNELDEAIEQFELLGNYENSYTYLMYAKSVKLAQDGNLALASSTLETITDFKDSGFLARYYKAQDLENKEEYAAAEELYASIATFRDSMDRINAMQDLILERDFAQLLETWNKTEKIESDLIQSTEKLLSREYHNSDTKLLEDAYHFGESLLESDRPYAAIVWFNILESKHYSDSSMRVKDCNYRIACSYLDKRDYESARGMLLELGEYEGAAEKLNECDYQEAIAMEGEKSYSAAYKLYTSLGEYKDAMVRAAYYADLAEQVALGIGYQDGESNLEQDYTRVIYWLELANEQGYALSSLFYENSSGDWIPFSFQREEGIDSSYSWSDSPSFTEEKSWFANAVIRDVAVDLAKKDGLHWNAMDSTQQNKYKFLAKYGGFQIYTTMNPEIQEQVDNIYFDVENIPSTRSEQPLESAIVVIDNNLGDIIAIAGGFGEKPIESEENLALKCFQTGSAEIPLSVYAPAFEKGIVSPASVVLDLPLTYDGGAFPKNDSRVYGYSNTVFQGIVSSNNAISANILNQIGTDYSFSFAKYSFGQNYLVDRFISESGIETDIAVAPLALGALTVGSTVREMSTAYATFANNGVYRAARTYTKVCNGEGEIVLENKQEAKQILSDKTVNYMNYCLYNAANSGAGTAAVFPGQYIAGKTGTTSSNCDRWFCGYTKYYTAAVWCGYRQSEQISLTGDYSNPAARLWKKVMQPLHESLPSIGLYNRNRFTEVAICLDSGLIASDACKNDARGLERVVFVDCYPEDIPSDICTKHVQVDYCITGNGVATDACRLEEGAVIEHRSLVKMTLDDLKEIQQAIPYGLDPIYGENCYICFVDENGEENYPLCMTHNS